MTVEIQIRIHAKFLRKIVIIFSFDASELSFDSYNDFTPSSRLKSKTQHYHVSGWASHIEYLNKSQQVNFLENYFNVFS